MKILVIGLDCATPELLLEDESLGLENLARLIEIGCHGRLESVIPPSALPAWMGLAASQDPGSLGIYGSKNRLDHAEARRADVDARSFDVPAIWDDMARQGKRSVIVGGPPGCLPRPGDGVSAVPVPTLEWPAGPGDSPAALGDTIRAQAREHFAAVRRLLQQSEWDYFQCVEVGLDRLQRGLWRYHDPGHVLHEPGSPFQNVIRDHYRYLDEEIGSLLELLTDDTAVLVVSARGARRLDGGFCVNQWLVREGLLVLRHLPDTITPLEQLDVDWDRSRVWSEAGDCALLYFNVRGREPRGVIEPDEYEAFRDEIKARLEATADPEGKPLGIRAYRPEELYRSVRGLAPDLIVSFEGLAWTPVGDVGYPSIHVRGEDAKLDDCAPAPHGAFVLATPGGGLAGPIEGAHLLDIAPTLLELGGHDVPPAMQGRSLAAGLPTKPGGDALLPEEEALIRERLSGLGYIA